MTNDLDDWIWPQTTNAHAVISALEEFGFEGLGLTADDFTEPDVVIQLGYPPNWVDLLTSPTGVDVDDCWQERLDVEMDGLTVPP